LAVLITSVVGLLRADWSDYKDASLSGALDSIPVVKGADYEIDANPRKYLLTASYTGNTRLISGERLSLIQRWGKSLRQEEFAAQYKREVLIQDGVRAWVPLQNSLVDFFEKEVKPGARARFYSMTLGTAKGDTVLVVNEFEVLK
jgi:hypothetical protein